MGPQQVEREKVTVMADIGNGKKADLYLKFIGILIVVVISLLTFTFNITRNQNNEDHKEIMASVVATQGMVQKLATDFRDWCEMAPPEHVHLDSNGSVMRKAGKK